MTEDQKTDVLKMIEARRAVAERLGLRATAKSWRDYRISVETRDAAEMILSAKPALETPT